MMGTQPINNISANNFGSNFGSGGFNNLIPNSNIGFSPNNGMIQNLSNLYPSIYRIINPVAARVVSNNNQPITEDSLNNMTDTVFNIVEGQIDIGEENNTRMTITENQINSNTNSNSNLQNTKAVDSSNRQNKPANFASNRNETLLRDIIKIIILKNLLSRNQLQRQMNYSPFGYTPIF